MNTITTTVPFPVKKQYIDIDVLFKKYVQYLLKKQKIKQESIEIDF